MKAKKLSCGLCGKKKNLIKTACCDNWICDDAHEYMPFSYAADSCYRNHDRYTLCSFHYHENHQGKWQNCKKCKDNFDLPNYVDYATNDANFEKLENTPTVTIKCVSYEFTSNSMQEFAFQTSNGFYCTKTKCQKSAIQS